MRLCRLCRHCHSRRLSRPRGLCWTCYYSPDVRQRYEANATHRPDLTGAAVPDFGGPAKWTKPTTALPGTPEKEAVLARRAQNGETLWHPEDARR